jgi:hypothetical protein
MIFRRNFPHLRRFLAFSLLTAAVFLSGCVYLRLLELKKQFARFDTFFKADTSDGVRIECLKPLLLASDVRWLGIFPETITPGAGKTENWTVRWVKEAPPGLPETTVHDVELYARFTGERLSHVSIPERYFEFFSKELFVNLLRSTGGARIDRGSRSADVENMPLPTAPEIKFPTRESIDGMLGRPTEQATRDGLDIFRYRYHTVTTEEDAEPIEVTFSFESGSGRLQKLRAKLPTGTINFRVMPVAKP